MIGIAIANSFGLNKLSGINPDAAAFIAATGITSTTEINAVNALVNGLQADGLWSKMKAVYPFVTDNRNVLGYSEDFGNAYWGKLNSTITSNSVTAPNGTTTADTFTGSSATSYIYTNTPISSIGNNTFSIYVKAGTLTSFRLDFATTALSYGGTSIINLTTGTAGPITFYGGASGWTVNVESVGNGWYRCSIGGNIATTQNMFCEILSAAGTLYLWGAQLEISASATTYQPIATTQQAYIASQFKYNLKDPRDLDAAFRLVFNGGWTHSSTGATPNGTNGYADTKLVPSTNGFTTANGHISFYSRDTSVNGQYPVDLGVDQTGTGLNVSQKMSSIDSVSFHGRAYAQLLTGVDSNNITGLHIVTRISTTSLKYNRNGSVIQTNSVLEAGTIPNVALFLGCTNNNGTAGLYSTRQAAFASIGNGLTDTEAANLYTRVQAFQTALNRQIS